MELLIKLKIFLKYVAFMAIHYTITCLLNTHMLHLNTSHEGNKRQITYECVSTRANPGHSKK